MKNSMRVGIIVCLAIVLAFSSSVALAGNEKVNATKSTTIVTKNITIMPDNISLIVTISLSVALAGNENANATKRMTNASNPFAKAKGALTVSMNRPGDDAVSQQQASMLANYQLPSASRQRDLAALQRTISLTDAQVTKGPNTAKTVNTQIIRTILG